MFGKILVSSFLFEASLISAFPSVAEHIQAYELDKRVGLPPIAPFPEYPGKPAHAKYNKFDAKSQAVSTSGKHRYIKPKKSDIRGPCAGLNAAANHGYIPRDGIATSEAINTGLFEAFGLDHTATLFLQTATMFFDGDPINGRWSIGPHSDKTSSFGAIGPLLGNETGICEYGHLKTEGDSSITRGDWLAPSKNDNCLSYPEFTQELLDLAKKMTGGKLTAPVMAQHQYNRKQHSIATNPNYFSPAYAGVAFTFGAHMFAYELLANHSAQHPRGILTPQVFETFFGYTRDKDGKLKYHLGQEKIPDNWYKRADDDQWDLEDIVISTAQQCESYPSNCQVGGNTGKVNSFAGVDAGDLTGGFLQTVEDLKSPAKMACFISQAIQADSPGFLDRVFTGAALAAVTALIPKKLQPALDLLGDCPNLPKGRSVFQYGKQFPGARFKTGGKRTTKMPNGFK